MLRLCSLLECLKKMIKEVTGHKSSNALEIYKRPTVPQKQALAMLNDHAVVILVQR